MREANAAQSIGTRLSPHPKTGAHNRRSSGERGDPIRAFGGGAAIPSEVDNRVGSEEVIHEHNGFLDL